MGSVIVYPLAENVAKPVVRLLLLVVVVTIDVDPVWLSVAWFGPPILIPLLISAVGLMNGLSRVQIRGRVAAPLDRLEFWTSAYGKRSPTSH